MSCETRPNRIAAAGQALGIARLAGKAGFYLGLTAATIGLAGALLLLRKRVRPAAQRVQMALKQRLSHQSRNGVHIPAISSAPPILSGRPAVAPTPMDKLQGKRCAQCNASPGRKPGPWYVLDGQACCQDCAQGAAQAGGVDLAVAPQALRAPGAASRPAGSTNKATTGRGRSARAGTPARVEQTGAEPDLFAPDRWPETRLQEAEIIVTLVLPAPAGSEAETTLAQYPIQEAFAVLTGDGRETGLGLAPMVEQVRDANDKPQVDKQGRPVLRTNDQGWNVVHGHSGFVLAGPFAEPGQARRLAALIAHRDWTRPLAEIDVAEVMAVQQLDRQVRQDQVDRRDRREATMGKYAVIPPDQVRPGDVYKFIPPSGQGPVFADVLEVYPEQGQVVIQLWDREGTRMLAYAQPPQGQVVFGRRLETEGEPT